MLAAIAVIIPAARGVIIFAPAAGIPILNIFLPAEMNTDLLGSVLLTISTLKINKWVR